MRVLVAPNALRECLPALDVGEAIASGVADLAEVTSLPLADGGDGTRAILSPTFDACIDVEVEVEDQFGHAMLARFSWSERERVAVIEMAEVSGLARVPADRRCPWYATTRGVGELIAAALDLKADWIVVGAGGAATLDAGAGAAEALGLRLLDTSGRRVAPTPAGIARVASIDATGLDRRLETVRLLVLSDVRTALIDNARYYGRSKGISSQSAPAFVASLARLGQTCGRPELLTRPWLGAGGGLGFMLSAFARAHCLSGATFVADRLKLSSAINDADFVITAEGRLDSGTFEGKVTAEVLRQARAMNRPCVILAGAVSPGISLDPPDEAIPIAATPSLDPQETRANLAGVGRQVVRSWALCCEREA